MSDWETPQYRPGQRIKLTDLSNDILTVLAQCISEQKFASTQYRLSECTSYFKQLASPFLPLSYSEGNDEYPASEYTQLQLFLIEILARPEYARRIRTYQGDVIRFRDSSTGEVEDPLDVSMFTGIDWTRIRAAIQELEPDGERSTLWDIERGSWEAMTTLALSRLPYLEDLEFHNWAQYGEDVPSLVAFLNNAAKRQKEIQGSPSPLSVPLAHLGKVSISCWDTESGMGLDNLEMFMQLKSVEIIYGHMIHGEEEDYGGDDSDSDEGLENDATLLTSEAKYPNILDIDLNYSSIGYRELGKFLSECPNVQKFRYDDAGMVEDGSNFVPPKFMLALKQSRASLQELIIEFEEGWGEDILEHYPLGSFAEFPKLKTITTSTGLLIGCVKPEHFPGTHSDDGSGDEREYVNDKFPASLTLVTALPPNLERLNIYCNVPATTALIELLENIRRFPSLKHFDVGWKRVVYCDKPLSRKPSEHANFSAEEVDTLLDLCDKAGVTMVMHALKPPQKILQGWIHNAKVEEIPALIAKGGVKFGHMGVDYPYTDWEKLCEQYQCDVETGRRVGADGLLLPSDFSSA